jgi:hypothetical protein
MRDDSILDASLAVEAALAPVRPATLAASAGR